MRARLACWWHAAACLAARTANPLASPLPCQALHRGVCLHVSLKRAAHGRALPARRPSNARRLPHASLPAGSACRSGDVAALRHSHDHCRCARLPEAQGAR
eukprot:6208556-Pleurochrysis_carterae.AAC.2